MTLERLAHAIAPVVAPTNRLLTQTLADPAMQARAREGRAAAKAARALLDLRFDFIQEPYWLELARRYAMRLPAYGIPMTPSAMRRWLHKLGYDDAWYRRWSGLPKLADFIALNKRWPVRAFVGLLLEEQEAVDGITSGANRIRPAAIDPAGTPVVAAG